MKKNPSSTSRALTARLIAFAAVGAYFTVLFFGGLFNGHRVSILSTEYIIYFNPLTYAIAWTLLTGILVIYGTISRRMVYAVAWLSSVLYAIQAAILGESERLSLLMCGIVAIMTVLVGQARLADPTPGRKSRKELPKSSTSTEFGGKLAVGITVAVAGGYALFLLLSSYLTYTTTPSVSTGVYAQLMHALRSDFSFDTTLEFGESVSHLGVHISPIFLIFLPFYAILPSPVTLLTLQVIAVYSAVVPLWLIARRRGLSAGWSATLCGLLCLYPAIWGGAVGSFHEYALLLPLLLWLFWALDSHRSVLMWIFFALSLCVRETVGIHLLSIGLYWVIRHRHTADPGVDGKRERRKGLLMAGISLAYFIVAMVVLTYAGKGTLITRFDNLTGVYATDFGTLIREILCNPALTIYELMSEAKLLYLLGLLLPLGLIPLCRTNRAGLIFLLPLCTLNLLADYPYHYNMNFPYSFGISALLFYLTAVALAERTGQTAKEGQHKADGRKHERHTARLLTLAICFTLILGACRLTSFDLFVEYAFDGSAEVEAMNELLAAVEPDASVSASVRLCPNLATRDELYTLSHKVDTDIVVLDLRDEWQMEAEAAYTVKYYEEKGYKVVEMRDGVGAVLRK